MRSIYNILHADFKPAAMAVVVASGLVAGHAQALTTTATFDLGTIGSGTTIGAGSVLSPAWIPAGSLPSGSILKSVSIDARIDTEGGGDTFANDLFVYVDPGAPPSGGEILQVGGFDGLGSPTTSVNWVNGGSGTLGTTCIDTKSAPADFPDGIDLNGAGVYIGSRGLAAASWSGSVTVEYEVFEPAAIKSFGPGAVVGDLVGNAADITWALPPGTDLMTLAPTFTLSSGSCDKDNGGPTTYDFSNPVEYTVTDGGTVNTYTVTVTIPDFLLWNVAGDGVWDQTTPNWLSQPSGTPASFSNGTEVVFDNAAGGTITVEAGTSPLSTTVGGTGIYTFAGGPLAGGDLTVSAPGTLNLSGDTYSSTISISGDGTVGRTLGGVANQALNYDMSSFTGTLVLTTGMTAVNPFYSPSFVAPPAGTIRIEDNTTMYLGWQGTTFDTTVELAGSVDSGGYGVLRGDTATLNGAVVLATDSTIGSAGGTFTINAAISDGGAGYGFTKVRAGTVVLTGTNTYSGPTGVAAGVLQVNSPDALGGGDLSIGGGTVNLNYSGSKALVSLSLGGVEQTAAGTYGSATSGADFPSGHFSGSGTVTLGDPSVAAFITSFGANVPGSAAQIGTVGSNAADVTWYVPGGTDLALLAPEFVLSGGATCSDQISGAVPSPGFDAGPVVFTVVSPNGLVTNTYTVTVTVLDYLQWNIAGDGDWDTTASNWLAQPSGTPTAFANGVEVVFDNAAGGTITVLPGVSPFSTTVSGTGTYNFTGGPIAGGELTVDSPATLVVPLATYTGPVISGSGTVSMPLGGGANKPLNFDMSSFTGTLQISGGMSAINPAYSPAFIAPTGGTISIQNNTTLYLGWQGTTFDTTMELAGSIDNGEGFGVLRGDTATLNGTVVLATDSTIGSAGGTFTINAVIDDGGSGYGFTKVGGGTLVLSAPNIYSGPTGVSGGILQVNSPDALGGGDLSISGGTANLNYSGTRTVASLTLGGLEQTLPGTYGSDTSGADYQSASFAGTGTVTLAGSSSPYDSWAEGPFLNTLTDSTTTLDFDAGGLATGIEWAVGGDPTDPADDAGLMPTGTIDETGTYLVFTYQRSDVANDDPNTSIIVEYDTDLQGTWTDASGAPGVVITPTDNGVTDTIEVKIPLSLASPGTTLFARLNVVVTIP